MKNLYRSSLTAIRKMILNMGGTPPKSDNFLEVDKYLEVLAALFSQTGTTERIAQLNALSTSAPEGAALALIAGALVAKGFNEAFGPLLLGSDGKVPLNKLPQAIAGGLNFLGSWDASANSPTLADGALYNGSLAAPGSFVVVSAAGSTVVDGDGPWSVGDWALSGGAAAGWIRLGQVVQVTSVRGNAGVAKIGDVVLSPSELHAYLGGIAGLSAPTSQSAIAFNGTAWTWAKIGGNLGLIAADSNGRVAIAQMPAIADLRTLLNPEYTRRDNNLSDIANAATARNNLGIPALLASYVDSAQLNSAIAAHVAAADPHPIYLSEAEGDARYISSAIFLTPLNSLSGAAAGVICKLTDGTYRGRSIEGSAGIISVTNPLGATGNITISLESQSGLTPGTYSGLTVNLRGLVTAADAIPALPVYTVATLPSATGKDGAKIWVSDAVTSFSGWSNTPGAIAIAVGGAWRSQADGLPLSTQPYYRQITANATLNPNNRIVRATGGSTITLASAASCAIGTVQIKNRSNNLITVAANSSEFIDEKTSVYLTPDSQLIFRVFDSTNWDTE